MADSVQNGESVAPASGQSLRYKSFKKKYMKIRAKFHETMQGNNDQWEMEQKLMKISRRLEEELDQLRELLVDVNESPLTPAHLHIKFRSSDPKEDALLESLGFDCFPPGNDEILEDNAKYTPEAAAAMLAEAKKEFESGAITAPDLEDIEQKVGPYIKQGVSLAALQTTVPHTRLRDVAPSDLPADVRESSPVGYLQPDHESEYLERLDAELDGRPPSDQHPIRGPPVALNPARDNPMSALNWLRVNQPQVFLQDSDTHDKGSHLKRGSHDAGLDRPRGGKGKRGSLAHEVLDEEGFVISAVGSEGSGRGKRKRGIDGDEAYNPKGGSRRRSKKQSLGEHD